MKFSLALLAVLALAVSSSAMLVKKPQHTAGGPAKPALKPTPPPPHKSHNFRNDFDQVLFAFVEEHLIRAEQTLFDIQHEVNEMMEHPSQTLKERIILQINRETVMLQETLAHMDTQKDTRKDFNDLEIYFVEKMYGDCNLLIKHFNHLKASIQKK